MVRTEPSPSVAAAWGRRSDDEQLAAYSRDPWVRRRILEYCGATGAQPPTAPYLAVLRGDERPYVLWQHAQRVTPADVGDALRSGDVSRALADDRNLLLVLDLDYQNVDIPAEPFTHPAEVFFKLERAYDAVQRVCAAYDLPTLACMTGRGYHFAGRVPLEASLVDVLAQLLPDPPPWFTDRRRVPRVPIPERVARASAGLGVLLEFLVHRILRVVGTRTPIPVIVNGTLVGSGQVGRECVSVDISHVGDPLDVRSTRVAFGTYRWHRFRPDIFGAQASKRPPIAVLPRGRQSLQAMLTRGRDLAEGRRAARHARATLPVQTAALERVLHEYTTSPLAAFHRAFYGAASHRAAPTLRADALPPCMAASLRTPNDLLLRPEHVQHLTRGLQAIGWAPRQIAELVCQVYESDHGWADTWATLHPRSRAEFDVRVFSGLIATGVDRLLDFNCVSTQEKGLCPVSGCSRDLRVDRSRLLQRQAGGQS